jgi:hypothetical protein
MKNGKERLFEMMEKVGGMPSSKEAPAPETGVEADLPPGFTENDIMDLDEFVTDTINEEVSDIQSKDVDVNKMVGDIQTARQSKEVGAKTVKTHPFLHSTTIKGIVDKQTGKEVDLDLLKKEITQIPDRILGQNGKMGKSDYYNISLPSMLGLFFDEKEQSFKVVNTCTKAGACKKYCYAWKGNYVMFERSSINKTRILNYLLNNWEDWEVVLTNEINNIAIKNKKNQIDTVIRWHDSGDFLSPKYLQLAMDIARKTPDALHYAYTKQVSMVSQADKPENFLFRFSFGGQEDKSIDVSTQKHAVVIPRELTKDIMKHSVYTVPNGEQILKDRLAQKFGLDKSTILTFQEVMNIPYDKTKEQAPKWNVIVTSKDSDNAAIRKDVLGIYLIEH